MAGIASLLSTVGLAGVSLDEALTRHEALTTPANGRYQLAPLTLVPRAPDGVTFAVGGPGNDIPPLLRPEARGDGGLQLRSHTALAGGAVQARLGVAFWPGDDHSLTFDESSLSARFGIGELYASVERRHWGPGWTQSLILDGGARPLPAVGWRKTESTPFASPWLSWLGPWNIDVFAGRLNQRIGPSQPYLFGARVQFAPLSGLELGVSRTIQWGGSGRPESLKSLWKAVIGDDNAEPEDSRREPGNQLAGFDARYTLRFAPKTSASLYAQTIGEDEAGGLPSRRIGSIGGDTAFPIGAGATARVFIESSSTAVRGFYGKPLLGLAYTHDIYLDGYTQLGDPLAHPAGGDIHLTSLGGLLDTGRWTGSLIVHRGNAYQTATLYPGGGRLFGVNGELAWQVDATSRIGLALMHWRDPSDSRTRAQLWWQLAFR